MSDPAADAGDAPETSLIRPIEQDTVMLFGHPVRAVRLPDGQIAASFNDMIAALGVQRSGQMRRIQEDDTISDQLLPALLLEPDGTELPSDVLTAWAIPLWLMGIQPSRLAPPKRPTIRAFKREAADVLYQHFSQRQNLVSLAAPAAAETSVVPAAPLAPPATPAPGASIDERIAYYEAMAAYLHWRQDIETWRETTDARLGDLEGQVNEIAAIIPGMVERLGEAPLTPAHQSAIQEGVTFLHDALDMPHATIYNELRRAFKVAKYDQIPDARWEDVRAWFGPRVEAARKQARAKGQPEHDPFADDQDDQPEQGSLF